MSTPEERNHAQLSVALDDIKAHLYVYLDSRSGAHGASGRSAAAPIDNQPGALASLQSLFGLSDFERRILVLCAGVELDDEIARLCSKCLGSEQSASPNFGLALAAFPDPHWSALALSGPLRRWMLISFAPTPSIVAGALHVDERILSVMLGLPAADERLTGILHPAKVPSRLTATHETAAKRAAALSAAQFPGEQSVVVQLCGPDPIEITAIAATAAHINGLGLYELDSHAQTKLTSDVQSQIRLIEREMLLTNSALLIDTEDAAPGADPLATTTTDFLASSIHACVFLSTQLRRKLRRRRTVVVDVDRPPALERRTLWEVALGDSVDRYSSGLDLLSDQFDLSAGAISSVGSEVLTTSEPDDADAPAALWEACRRAARPRLDELAQRIDSTAGWDDLILTESQTDVLHSIAAHVRGRQTVYEDWGFSSRGSRGLGITALFAGASGTGKTMAAEVLSRELKLDLYRIDLSSVMSKYIGETEKNLRRVFDAADQGGSILLFDEADALFGKRSDVKDSHDRFANIEVSYLLQRMECYRGLAILTTNLKSALDNAFLRRIRFIVQFPFPDVDLREEMWKRAYPKKTPTDSLDYRRLAQMNLTGGHIRNIALNSAFIAAEAGDPITMTHIAHAAEAEYSKLEKPLTEAERAGWADTVR